MVKFLHAVLGLLILQIYVRAAPSTSVEQPISKEEELVPKNIDTVSKKVVGFSELEEPSEIVKLEEPTEGTSEETKLDSEPLLIEQDKLDKNSTQSLRQKRFYNFFGNGVPPINSIVYPGYNKRDQSAETGVYGLVEDPLEQIQRRLHDLASFVRQPEPPPPPPTHFPFFLPVIYIPQYGCDCKSDDTTKPSSQPDKPQTPRPENNQTDPDPDKRFPDLSDDRQNWGFVTNESDTEYDDDEFSRPISFDPIQPNRPLMRPAPPVDHGSNQGNSANTPQSTTTVRPTSPPRRPPPPPPPPQNRPSSSQGRPVSSFGPSGQSTPYPPSFGNDIPRNEQPNRCDGAVLSCCHQQHVTYDCFAAQGCSDLTSYGNPCDPLVILQVVDKFQKFYGVRNEN